jgi:hypothetical protein
MGEQERPLAVVSIEELAALTSEMRCIRSSRPSGHVCSISRH